MNIPKRISIIVKRGENLEYTSSLKKASKNRRWRVIFLGGEDKLASEYVDAEDGCPKWDCEVTLDLISPSDPVCLRVVDGDNHHIGQVNIPLNQIPQTGNPNFDLSRLSYSELEPTRKNSHPHGRLVYWIWAIDYWPPGTQVNTIQHSKSLRGSLNHIGAKIRSKSRHKSKSNLNNGYAASEFSGSTLQVPGMSYNPFENDGTTSEFGGPTGLPPMYQSNANSPYAQSELGGSLASSTKSSGKHRGLLRKVKSKISHSTLNLAEAVAKKAAGKDPYFQNLDGGSKSNLRGSQLSIGGTSYRGATSQLDLYTQPMQEQSQSLYNQDDSSKSKASVNSFLDDQGGTTPIQQRTDGVGEVSSAAFESPASVHLSTWGAQPNDRPSKPIEDMTKRETVEYVNHLLKTLQSSRTEITRLQMENGRLTSHANETETELNDVRMTLATLRNRLLADNLTEYLELPSENNGYMGVNSNKNGGLNGIGGVGGGGFTTNLSGYDNSQIDNTPEPQSSFLSKISSLGINARITSFIPPSSNLPTNGNGASAAGGGSWW
uniref:C2 domain-containing protein n=1 Tax=Trichobilharzia regenti TaxID=157069 RepID=A0AA85J5V3_TRIRE|nr:unnamed protein product [Trichobilharzia regenti]